MINEDRRYIIFNLDEISLVDFNEVEETSADSLRISVDGKSAILKYNLPQPYSVSLLTTKSVEYTYSEIISIICGPEWSYTEEPDGY